MQTVFRCYSFFSLYLPFKTVSSVLKNCVLLRRWRRAWWLVLMYYIVSCANALFIYMRKANKNICAAWNMKWKKAFQLFLLLVPLPKKNQYRYSIVLHRFCIIATFLFYFCNSNLLKYVFLCCVYLELNNLRARCVYIYF